MVDNRKKMKVICIEKDIVNFLKIKNQHRIMIFLFFNDIHAYAFESSFKLLLY